MPTVDDRPRSSWSERSSSYLRERNPVSHRVTDLIERLRHRASPNHWSSLFGVIAGASLVVLVVTD